MFAVLSSALAFSPPSGLMQTRAVPASSVVMSELGRRDVVTSVAGAAALFTPLASFADGAASKATRERARSVYGSRVFRLQGASAETILAEQNMITLFITGAYAGLPSSKDTKTELKGLSKKIIASATAGDTPGAQAGVKDFVKVASLRELDTVDGGNFNPKQRRNPGAPPTSEIEAQMGTEKWALYDSKPKAK